MEKRIKDNLKRNKYVFIFLKGKYNFDTDVKRKLDIF